MRDGSRPPATGLQEQVANHRKWLWSKALVVSVTEKVLRKHQVWIKKTNASEPPLKCRKNQMVSKRGELMLLRDESGGDLCTGQVAPGIEVA